jgi:hypothetical protein
MPAPETLNPDGTCPCGRPIILVKSTSSSERAVIKSTLIRVLGDGRLVVRCRACKRDLELPADISFGKSLRFLVRKKADGPERDSV